MGMNLMEGINADTGGTFTIEKKAGTLIKIGFVYQSDLSTKFTPAL